MYIIKIVNIYVQGFFLTEERTIHEECIICFGMSRQPSIFRNTKYKSFGVKNPKF